MDVNLVAISNGWVLSDIILPLGLLGLHGQLVVVLSGRAIRAIAGLLHVTRRRVEVLLHMQLDIIEVIATDLRLMEVLGAAHILNLSVFDEDSLLLGGLLELSWEFGRFFAAFAVLRRVLLDYVGVSTCLLLWFFVTETHVASNEADDDGQKEDTPDEDLAGLATGGFLEVERNSEL